MEKLPLISSPWTLFSITILYVIFVTKVGPKLMKSRKPLNLKPIILLYNLSQVFINALLLSTLFKDGAATHLWNHKCHRKPPTENPFWFRGHLVAWLFMISRIYDQLDTVFSVLTKKQSKVTFLHVYHHASTPVVLWYLWRKVDGENVVFWGYLNIIVHILMYTYYFMAALGPKYAPYLWWKRYLTTIQMIQFVVIAAQMVVLKIAGCPVNQDTSLIISLHAIINFILFANFYWQNYTALCNQQNIQNTSNDSVPATKLAKNK